VYSYHIRMLSPYSCFFVVFLMVFGQPPLSLSSCFSTGDSFMRRVPRRYASSMPMMGPSFGRQRFWYALCFECSEQRGG
jgi:hypothetical protein